jgi:hypothetical protein
MSKHVDLLGLLYVVAGALSALVAVSLLSLGLGAFTIAWGPVGERSGMAATLTGATFILVAVVLLVWAGLCAWAGRGLRRRRPWARLITLALSVLPLFILPFGTALGLYSLWVLVHHEARQQFEPGSPAPVRSG